MVEFLGTLVSRGTFNKHFGAHSTVTSALDVSGQGLPIQPFKKCGRAGRGMDSDLGGESGSGSDYGTHLRCRKLAD